MKIDIFDTQNKYDIIYADPPWSYSKYSDKAKKHVSKHYNTMSLEEIKSLPINKLASKNSVLLIWATFPNLPWAIETINAWGFKYKTCAFNWIKQTKRSKALFWGMGYYTRSNAEVCLIAVKGKPLKRLSNSIHSVIMSPVEEHSKKPDEVRERIVRLFGDRPRIELFARQQADGWDYFGNEI